LIFQDYAYKCYNLARILERLISQDKKEKQNQPLHYGSLRPKSTQLVKETQLKHLGPIEVKSYLNHIQEKSSKKSSKKMTNSIDLRSTPDC